MLGQGHVPRTHLRTGPPFHDVVPFGRALIEAAPDRVLWGTDWPHPNVPMMPDDGDLVDLVPLTRRIQPLAGSSWSTTLRVCSASRIDAGRPFRNTPDASVSLLRNISDLLNDSYARLKPALEGPEIRAWPDPALGAPRPYRTSRPFRSGILAGFPHVNGMPSFAKREGAAGPVDVHFGFDARIVRTSGPGFPH